ncbi:MAG: DUF4350 domain-containing protein [Planctomycetota bacterium]
MNEVVFHRRTVRWIVGLSVVSLLFGLLLSSFGSDLMPIHAVGASGYSRSALGHRALVDLLQELDVPVVLSRNDSARKVGDAGVLVVAEPLPDEAGSPNRGGRMRRLRRLIDRTSTCLLVLPKWEGEENPEHRGWVSRRRLLTTFEVERVLKALDIDADVVRVPVEAEAPLLEGEPRPLPTPLPPVLQLLSGKDLVPRIRAPDGSMLLAKAQVGSRTVWVLADPDPMANVGLGRGGNAAFVVGLLDDLRRGRGAVIFDETLHGFEAQPSIWREVFTFPLVLVVLHLALVSLVLLWGTVGRFGAPQPAPPALEPGTRFLIENTVEVLRHGVRSPTILPRYLDATVRDVLRALPAPRGLGKHDVEAWLDTVASRRGCSLRLAALRTAADEVGKRPAQTLAVARRIHHWREEILHGPSDHPHDA